MAGASLDDYLKFADDLSEKAAKVMVEGYFSKKDVELKEGRSWDLVTDYDKKVEELITNAIKQTYPDHLVLAEEDTSSKSKKAELTNQATWIIDPIDGTYNYVHGLPFTCISIALSIEREIVIGLVYNPLSKDKYTAIRGKGAFLNGRRINVSQQPGLNEAIVSFEISLIRVRGAENSNIQRFLEITRKVNGVRSIGSAALTLCLLASGGIDAYFVEFIQAWDMAAGYIIIKEAGGYIRSIKGGEFDLLGRSILATANKKIADDILEVFEANP